MSKRMTVRRTYFTAIRQQTAGTGFFDDSCKEFYLRRLLHCQNAFQVRLHAYLLTRQQVFLLFTPLSPSSFDAFSSYLNKSYNNYYLTRFERRVQVWQESASLCYLPSNELVLNCQKFIERFVLGSMKLSHPGEYRYSSYCANAFVNNPSFLRRHRAIKEFMQKREDALQNYRDFIAAPFREEYAKFLHSRLLTGRQVLSRKAGLRLEKTRALTDIDKRVTIDKIE